jgi:hypothetical protein
VHEDCGNMDGLCMTNQLAKKRKTCLNSTAQAARGKVTYGIGQNHTYTVCTMRYCFQEIHRIYGHIYVMYIYIQFWQP